MLKDHKWLLEPIVATCCCVAVLLVTAGTPDKDEFTRGIPAGLVAYLMGKLSQKGGT
jgi:hypothetical protein